MVSAYSLRVDSTTRVREAKKREEPRRGNNDISGHTHRSCDNSLLSSCPIMAFPFVVCSICFEKYGKNETKIESLLKSKCLERPNRHTSVSVRVRRVDGVLEPQVRPMPRVYFTGHFVNCDPNRCRGEGCTFPHCSEEKDAWNAQKFGLDLNSSAEEGAADSHPQSTQAGATVAADQPSRTWCNHSLPDTSLAFCTSR